MKVACIQSPASDWKDADVAWGVIKDLLIEAAKTNDFVIVPEAVYPAYFLPESERTTTTPIDEVLVQVQQIAKDGECYIAFGYADGTENSAVLYDPTGQEIASKSKSYLWHFDHRWFKSGEDVVICDTKYGRAAIVICADARLPELVRSAALSDIRIIVDLANLTASGPYASELTNAQCEFMLATRAQENGVWLAVADKWGVEADTVTYAGRSAVYNPDGVCVSQAPSDKTTILSVDIPLDRDGKIEQKISSPLPERRPELYDLLVADTPDLPIYPIISESVTPELITPYLSISALNTLEGNIEQKYLHHLRRFLEHEPDLVVLPIYPGELRDLSKFQHHLERDQHLIVSDIVNGRTRSRLCSGDAILTTYVTLHSRPQAPTKLVPSDKLTAPFPSVSKLSFGNVAIMHDHEGLLPEVSRCLMLAGADLIIWPNSLSYQKSSQIARTRAAESRIYVASVYSSALSEDTTGASFIVNPNGAIMASSLLGRDIHGASSFCPLTTSRSKSIVPGTHVLFDRKPKKYRRLIEQ